MNKITVKVLKMHKFLVWSYKSHDFLQSQENYYRVMWRLPSTARISLENSGQSGELCLVAHHETVTFRNSEKGKPTLRLRL
jgi:hypothetical protein